MEGFYETDLFSYVILPLLIVIARISDVSIGTLRIVMVSKGQKIIAPLLGFFEVVIWLITMSKVIQNIENWVAYVAYGLGFALGNYIGLILEEKLAVGVVRLQIITRANADQLILKLRENGYGITYLEANGSEGKVAVIYSIIKRSNIQNVIDLIRLYNPQAFYSVADVRFVSREVYSPVLPLSTLRRWRKGK
ncbi:MAG: DUF2179 domain-containing protein [Mangrovibacterium sp.]|nr:DUF2179 domain-containing protein [Mangrovibacterium sp.]